MNCSSNKNKVPLLSNLLKGVIIGISILIIFHYIIENSSIYFRYNNLNWPRPFTLHLNRQELYLVKGEEFRLYVIAINKRVSYSSTNFRVAGVNFNGRVFAYQPGKAFILAKVDKRILKCRVHVLTINKDKLTVKPGETKRLKIIGSNAFVTWKSANPRVVSVNMFGTIKAKKKGRTIIYAKVKGKTLKCVIRVK